MNSLFLTSSVSVISVQTPDKVVINPGIYNSLILALSIEWTMKFRNEIAFVALFARTWVRKSLSVDTTPPV